MRGRAVLKAVALTIGAWSLLAAIPANAAGFGIFEQGTKAMGMAGAFTAQADDPSALFHNVGGIAFQDEERSISAGVTLISLGDSEFTGAAPFPGPTATGEGASNLATPPHVYYLQPINDTWTFGLGLNAPFGLVTEWENPDQFPGRFLSTKAELQTIDITPSIGWRLTPNFGIGFSGVARVAGVELSRRVARVNPFTGAPAEVAKVTLESGLENIGYGFNLGLLHKVNNSFSWGLSYRSKVKIDFEGDGRFTQVATGFPQFDAAVAAAVPFGRDLPIETTVEFPDMASFGVAIALTANSVMEVDANWTGWSSFEEINIVFTENPAFNSRIPEEWEDVYNYRLGFRWNSSAANQWRVGYVYDETPQPTAAASPLLPDENRNGFTLGFGHTLASGKSFDLALMYLDFDDRVVDEVFEEDAELGFFGTYKSTAILFGLTVNL